MVESTKAYLYEGRIVRENAKNHPNIHSCPQRPLRPHPPGGSHRS